MMAMEPNPLARLAGLVRPALIGAMPDQLASSRRR
jgi:hypothetical protein